MANKMLIDATHPEETRVVVLRGNRVEEFDFETAHRKQLRGNIYLAKVTRVEPSLQAAFVEYGGNRHGFLAFSEIHPDYYQIPVADRQALLDDDARAAREHDDDEHGGGQRGGRRQRGGRNRHRDRAHTRNDETVQSDPLASGGAAAQPGENPSGESSAFDAPHHQESGQDSSHESGHESGHESNHESQPYESQPAAVGETANPPVSAEIGTPVEHPQPEFAADSQLQPHDSHSHDDDAAHADSGDAGQSVHDGHGAAHDGASHDGAGHEGNGQEGNGHDAHGADEEEEVVESVGGADAMEEVPDRAPRYRRQYKIQEVIKRRQVMLVQVVKEERGTKGAALTTYLSLAGRYCVLMPNTARGGGISRKITSSDDRKKLREIAEELEVPEGMGVILRTAGAARTKAEVKRDFEYLLRQWELVRDLTLQSSAPTLVYEEGSLAKRSIRDLYSKDIDEIVVAGEQGYRDAKEFMRMLMPSHAKNVKLYQDSQPIYTRYGIESQLDAMFSPTVQLRSGGYIVLNQTEALVAIDVNSGRSTREHHIEDTALKTNCEAAEEVARQLRLRDLAGLIVIDFIDMDEKRNNRTVERRMKDALRNDRARIQVGRISHFGLLEMSRQRIRTSVLESSTEKCPHCGGTGHVRSVSSVALQLLRSVEEQLLKGPTHNLIVRTLPDTALYVLNHKRAHLSGLEQRFRVTVTVNADEEVGGQVGFTIDRGEQVMTPDQARALLAQAAEAAPVLFEEEEPETESFEDEAEADHAGEPAQAGEIEEIDDEAGESMRSDIGRSDSGHADNGHGESSHDSPRDGEQPREGGRGRRRRRRGRGGSGRNGGRGGEGREGGSFQPHGEAQPYEGGTGFAADPSQEQPASGAEFAPGEAMPGHDGTGHDGDHQPRHSGNGGPPEGEDGEPRRRRRGRRGGRRNRREREPGSGDFAATPGKESDERPEYSDRTAPHMGHADHQPDTAPREESRQESRQETQHQPRYEPQPEIAPVPHAPPPQPAAAEPAEPPRRRSTVREPAPVFGASSPAVTPIPMPQPAPPPAVASEAPAEDANKPRRTGWWAKRLLGGDKG